jgi:peroxiredoxin
MIALRSRIQLDPWVGSPDPAASFADLPTLLASFHKEEEQLDLLEDVFFPRESALRRVLSHRNKAAALEALIAAGGRPAAEIEEARVELLRTYRPHAQGPRLSAVAEAKLDEGCRRYIADYPEGRYLPEVKLIHAEYRLLSGLRSLTAAQREQIPQLCDEFRGEAEAIIAEAPRDPAAGLALLWLTELDFNPRYGQRDLAGALEKYRRVVSDYLDMPGVAEQAARVSALAFFDQGIPAFQVSGIDGESISLEDFRGKILLLYFWSTTSKPATDEIANLKWIEEKFEDEGVAVVGVSLDQGDLLPVADFSRWVEANNISWPQYYDGRGLDNQLARLFGVSSVPFVFVIDRDGTLADAGLTGKELELAVAGILD